MDILKKSNKKYSLHYIRFLLIYIILGILFAVADVFIIKTTGSISQSAISGNMQNIKNILITMAVFTAAKIVFDGMRVFLTWRNEAKTGYKIRKSFFEYLTQTSFKDLTSKSSGNMLSIYSNDLPSFIKLFNGEILDIISGIIVLIVGAIFMFRMLPIQSLIFFLLYIPLSFMQIKLSQPIAPLMAERSKQRGNFNNVVNDSLQNTSIILSYGLQKTMEERYLKSYNEYFIAAKNAAKKFLSLIISGIMASFLPIIFITIAGGAAVIKNKLSMGEFIVLTSLAGNANTVLTMLSQNLSSIQQHRAEAKHLINNSETVLFNNVQNTDTYLNIPNNIALSIKNLCFSYNDENNIIDNISLDISKGSNIAFVGKSGCGKSTLAKLILGLYKPNSGTIFYSHKQTNPSGICSSVAYVPQDSFLFPDTIKQNICCTENPAEIDEAKLIECTKAAGIHNFIMGMPKQYNSYLEPGAENLSGGQKQRVAIARALYADTPVLLMDEATSALDTAAEQSILSHINNLDKEKTVISVAHRLAAVENCDCIYYMEKGQIIESGTYEELCLKQGKFYALYKNQQEEFGHAN